MTDDPDAAPRRRRPRAARAVPITPDMLEGAPRFAPVPRHAARYDGWTYPRQRAFIKALAETGSVARACQALGMTTVGVYLLRKTAGGEGFAAAWAEAQGIGVQRPRHRARTRDLRRSQADLLQGRAGGRRTPL